MFRSQRMTSAPRIDQWNEKYQKQLGNLRAFLESQPAGGQSEL